jgi:hypothetical protein
MIWISSDQEGSMFSREGFAGKKSLASGILVLFAAGCISTLPGKKPCVDMVVMDATHRLAYNECGFNPPILDGYRPVEMLYVSMPESIPQWAKDMYKVTRVGLYAPAQFEEEDEQSLAYKVTFRNKQGKVIEKFWHKTNAFAFTIKEPGGKPYTLIAGESMGIYALRKEDALKYEKYDTSHWKIRHPEPDDFNPYLYGSGYSGSTNWRKMCEWWPETE